MTEPKPKPFNIKLSDEDRAALERIRAARGLRSSAEALRDLIAEADPVVAKVKPAAKAVEKAAPFVTRLKGEWKAP